MAAAIAPFDGWQHIVSSPLLRCQAFASNLASEKNVSMHLQQDLSEICFGDWDGLSFKAVEATDKTLFDGFWNDPFLHTPPNGEPMQEFCQRIASGFWQAVKQLEGQHVLMVVHGGVIRAILKMIMQSDNVALMRYEVPYACLSRIKIYHDNKGDFPQLVFHNR